MRKKDVVKSEKKKVKSLVDFYGKLPNTFGNGVEYQRQQRDVSLTINY